MATISPLRQRMIEDMTIRNLSRTTQQRPPTQIISLKPAIAALQERSARCPVAHTAPMGVSIARDSIRCWMKVQWQVKPNSAS
jgi:hypothetical protein